jgi:hypothetical protein
MQSGNRTKMIGPAGTMAALLMLALVAAAPTSLYAQSDDKMMDKGAMTEKSGNLTLNGSISNVQLGSNGGPE